jgi:hypothetical protein
MKNKYGNKRKVLRRESVLRTKVIEIHYEMNEIKPSYWSLNSLNKEVWLWLL